MGCDDGGLLVQVALAWFQSTHPHGVRLYRKKPVIYLGFGVRFREPLRKARALCYMSEQYLPISQLQDLREPHGEINIT